MPHSHVNKDPDSQAAAPHDETPRPACRVMHVINGEHYSGAERVQDLLATGLRSHGFEVSFACVKPGQFASCRQDRRAPIHNVPMSGRFDLKVAFRLSRIVRSESCQLLHAHTPRSLLVARFVASLADLPLVYHLHSPTAEDSTHRVRNWFNHHAERFSLAGVGRIITVSHSLAERMAASGIPRERMTVVHNGVPAGRPASRVPGPTWTLGTVALFRPRKGLEVLLDALALARQVGLPVHLRAVGRFESADYERAIKHHVDRLQLAPHVTWTGFTSDVAGELEKMDLFVLPSLFGEGLPMVVLEAMAAGVPVVATEVEGVPEAVRDGIDGVLARPGDAESLTSAIERVIGNVVSWHELRAAALERHAEHFSDQAMSRGVAEVYRRVTAGLAVR